MTTRPKGLLTQFRTEKTETDTGFERLQAQRLIHFPATRCPNAANAAPDALLPSSFRFSRKSPPSSVSVRSATSTASTDLKSGPTCSAAPSSSAIGAALAPQAVASSTPIPIRALRSTPLPASSAPSAAAAIRNEWPDGPKNSKQPAASSVGLTFADSWRGMGMMLGLAHAPGLHHVEHSRPKQRPPFVRRPPPRQSSLEFCKDTRTAQGWRLDESIVEHDEPPDELLPRRVAMGSVWLILASQEPDTPVFVDQGQERLFSGWRRYICPGLALASSKLPALR
jgi:hypothetical protein